MTITDIRPNLNDLDALNDPELIAVYGTLRTDCGNDRLWRGRAESWGTDTMRPFRMTTNGGYPYAIPDDDADTIVVELLHPDPDNRHALMADLDSLEGYPRHYNRIVAITDEGNAAWMYVPSDATMEYAAGLRPVPSGDWTEYSATARFRREW